MPWKFHKLAPLEKENDQLRTTIVVLRRELETKQGYAASLELMLHQRLETIDALNGKLEQSRQQVRQLDAECEHLVQLVRMS
jgi:hypothetical protein